MPVGKLQLISSNISPPPAANLQDGSTRLGNSFGDYGVPEEYVGPAFDPVALWSSPRALELEYRATYFHCKQHDHKMFRWDGSMLSPAQGIRTTQPMLGSVASSQYIPLSQRRPCAPYRLGRKMVTSFTGMLFGEGRWPQLRSEDEATQAAAAAIDKVTNLALTFVHGRNLAGSSGTVGFSWYFADGIPRVKAHRGSRIHVVSWADEDTFVPAHVIELKQATQIAPDPQDGKLRPQQFWMRRDWTLVADVVFKPCPVVSENLPVWQIDEERSRLHGDGECHFVWVSNLPSEDDTEDGACDYVETYEQMDQLDELNSVHVNGTKANLDPTLHLKLDRDDREGTGLIRKGTDNAIVTSTAGDAKYLQLADTQIGKETIELQRQQILEVNECVVLDPDKAAAAAASGEAQKLVYAPMIARCDVLRMQWGPAIERLINQMLRSWRLLRSTPVEVPVDVEAGTDAPGAAGTEAGEPPIFEEAVQDLSLPLRKISTNDAFGETIEQLVPHSPGEGFITVEWGPYFKPTGAEKQSTVGSIAQAVGGKPVLSQRAGVELIANLYDRDANAEWQAIQAAAEEQAASEGAMFGGTGGEVDAGDGALPPSAAGAALVELAPTEKIKTMTVNEVRAKAMGMGPLLLADGSPDPDGAMPFVAYMAKLETAGSLEAEAEAPPTDDDLPVPPPAPIPGLSD